MLNLEVFEVSQYLQQTEPKCEFSRHCWQLMDHRLGQSQLFCGLLLRRIFYLWLSSWSLDSELVGYFTLLNCTMCSAIYHILLQCMWRIAIRITCLKTIKSIIQLFTPVNFCKSMGAGTSLKA
jgi:hypothetical protein